MASGRSIRFTVIAHASPRWRGAANAADADKRNQILSQQRENSVRLVVVRILRETLGPSVEIRSAVDQMENVAPNGVSVGGYAVGSRDALRATKGNRDNNDEIYRFSAVTSSNGFTLRLTFPTGQSQYESIEFVKRMSFESLVEGYAKFYEEANP